MPARIEPDAPLALFTGGAAQTGAIAAILPDDEVETGALPREHPKWARDALLISHRARQVLSRLKPLAVRVLSFWDHAVRSIGIGGNRTLTVDSSGSYSINGYS